MLKVIKEDEYEADTPHDFEMDSVYQKKSNTIQPHELTDSESFAVDRLVNNQPRNEPIPAPVAEPRYQAPIKPGFHQIQDEVREEPMYQERDGRRYVKPHELSEEEAFYVDRVVNGGGVGYAPQWDETSSMAQQREWNGDMVQNSNYNDYIQDTPRNYPGQSDSIMRLPPNPWERYAFKDEKADRDAAIAKRAEEYANEPPVAAMQVRSRDEFASNIPAAGFVNEAVNTPVMAEYDTWETMHPRTYNETAWTANAPAGYTLEPTPLPISGTPATAANSPYLSQQGSNDWIQAPPPFDPWNDDQLKHMNDTTWKEGSPAGLIMDPVPLPIPAVAPDAKAANSNFAEYDHWTQETLNNSNPPVWIKDAPAGLTLEPTPLPITGTPQRAANLAQYDHWTEENHNHSNTKTWTEGAPAGFTVEPTTLPIAPVAPTAKAINSNFAQYDHWTEENHNHSNTDTWVRDAPTGFTLEPTTLPIQNTPGTAINSRY